MKHQMEMLDLHPLPPRELGMLELKILISGTLELELKPNVFFYGFFFFFNSFDNGEKKRKKKKKRSCKYGYYSRLTYTSPWKSFWGTT